MRLSCSRSLILIINIIIHFYFIVYNATSVVTIIGSTGTIGRSLLTRFTNSNNKVYASFRDQNKAKQLLNHLKDLNNRFCSGFGFLFFLNSGYCTLAHLSHSEKAL